MSVPPAPPASEPPVVDATRASEPPSLATPPAPSTADGWEVTVQRLIELWGRIRQDVKLQNRRIEALLAEVDPISVVGNVVTLRAAYPFHRNRLEEEEVREVVQIAIGKRVGQAVRVRTVLKGDAAEEDALPLVPPPPPYAPPPAVRPTTSAGQPIASAVQAGPDAGPGGPAAMASSPARPDHDDDAISPLTDQDDVAAVAPDADPSVPSPEEQIRVVDAARAIFDGEEIPDPLAEP